MTFEKNFERYLSRIERIRWQAEDFTEEATKTALIMPFFSVLGYDVFDTNEFMPEFTCDVATKKGEKVDYAILKDGEPIIIIEAKRAGLKLQKQQQCQLFRYFSTNRCRIAILTNGVIYQFFSDLNVPNIMDDEPFFEFNIFEDDPSIYISSVKQFCKEQFDIKNVISKAVFQKYATVVEKTLKQDLLNPSDELVKYFLSRPEVKTGNRITSQMIEKHREITRQAMRKVFGVSIHEVSDEREDYEIQVISENNESFAEESELQSVQKISENIKNILSGIIPDFSFISEDSADYCRLHIYTSANKKIGNVKIIKSDFSIQWKKTGSSGMYILKSEEDIKNYI
ncbi:MAG: type I restriction enzyme HsdR N-terminal domain-containing protein [Ruminococcus sp.]|nr:type I restriction enzyme HsdR N-terminal domain-containing protein [Ruminococcus sp.]